MNHQRDVQNDVEHDVEQFIDYYRTMLRIRKCEERIGWLFSRGLTMGTAHLSIGQEAVAVGVLAAAQPQDQVVSTHRGHGHLIAKGARVMPIIAEICGRENGYCRGKGGSQHIAVRDLNFLGTNGITGGGIPVATGAALTSKLLGTGAVAFSFFGEGAANQGTFHESLNMAAVWKLPIVYVCENNGYAMYTPQHRVTSVQNIADRAAGYGIPGVVVDGMDLLAVRKSAAEAVSRARTGHGPTLLECKTYRFSGHSKSDNGTKYRTREEIAAWQERDPLTTWREMLLALDVPESLLFRIQIEIDDEIAEATQHALSGRYAENEALDGAFAESAAVGASRAWRPELVREGFAS
jgi:TPP-dependent pyruvate/acetoin dehydrogenase alpha subunit